MIDVRRGITRLSVVPLMLWELLALYMWSIERSIPIWTYVHAAIVPPLVVWICWRTVLWIARGFVSERAR